MKNKICKCGHEEKDHYKDMVNRTLACRHKNCVCYQFEPQSVPENHSHPEVSMDEETRLKASGSDNSPRAKVLGGEDKGVKNLLISPEDTLSSKIIKGRLGERYSFTLNKEQIIEVPDIKEFIKKLKVQVKQSNEDFSWDSMKPIILKKIDKLAGAELT